MNKMKITLSFLTAGVFTASVVQAQSVQDGVKDLYAERFQSAKATFDKLLASNPNNIDATYWLGQTYLAMDDVAAAKAVYDKALTTSANAPLLSVGRGEVDLEEKKVNEARQRFEAAITMSSGKKGADPAILNAVGEAITDVYDEKDKIGDINFAVAKLEEAAAANPKDAWLRADIFTNLGDALRKAKPGENGGKAFENYQKANQADPNYPKAYLRTAMLFYSQKNWELYERYANQSVERDPKFAPGYYELAYYKMSKLDLNAAKTFAQKFKENADADPSNAYLECSMDYANKNYDQAIACANDMIAKSNGKPKPKVYKLIAYSLVDKKDTAAAKDYVDKYFANEKSENIEAADFDLKAKVYSVIPGQEQVVVDAYKEGIKADTSVDNKIALLKKGADFFLQKGQNELAGDLYAVILDIKPNATINDYFAAGYTSYYKGKLYEKAWGIFDKARTKFPTWNYAYQLTYKSSAVFDSANAKNILVPDAEKLIEFSKTDTAANAKTNTFQAAYTLANYYNDVVKDKAKAIEYLTIMKGATADPAVQAQIETNIKALSAPAPKAAPQTAPGTKPKTTTSGKSSAK